MTRRGFLPELEVARDVGHLESRRRRDVHAELLLLVLRRLVRQTAFAHHSRTVILVAAVLAKKASCAAALVEAARDVHLGLDDLNAGRREATLRDRPCRAAGDLLENRLDLIFALLLRWRFDVVIVAAAASAAAAAAAA